MKRLIFQVNILLSCLFTACVRINAPVNTPEKCTPTNLLNITAKSRHTINAALKLKIDSRRRKYNPNEFCAFSERTTNNKFYVLTIYDDVGNHRSETWILLGPKQAINTGLNVYQMATDDSLKTNEIIISSINKLNKLDNQSRNELIQALSQRALRERNRQNNKQKY